MVKTYTVSEDKFLEGKRMITSNGGTIYTDGSFEVKGVKGRFSLNGDSLTIVVTDKPWLASWGMIEKKLDEFFG